MGLTLGKLISRDACEGRGRLLQYNLPQKGVRDVGGRVAVLCWGAG